MKKSLWKTVAAASVLVLSACGTSGGSDDAYPNKTIRFVIPSSAGGGSDQFGRLVADYAKKNTGVKLEIANIEGGGTITGTAQALTSAKDGSTVVVTNAGSSTLSPAVQKDMPYKVSDFEFIARAATSPVVLVVKSDAPYDTAEDLLAAIGKDPKKFKFGTSALGGVSTFAFGGMLQARDINPDDPRMVVFNGGGDTVTALAGGQVDAAAQLVSEVLPMLRGGKLKALAVSGDERLPSLPDVPSATEAGIPEFNQVGSFGLAGPAGMDPAAVKFWEDVIEGVANDADAVKALEEQGNVPAFQGSKDYTAWVKEEVARVKKLASTMEIFD